MGERTGLPGTASQVAKRAVLVVARCNHWLLDPAQCADVALRFAGSSLSNVIVANACPGRDPPHIWRGDRLPDLPFARGRRTAGWWLERYAE